MRLDFAAGLHEGLRAALSHQQDAARAIDYQAGSDTDGGAHQHGIAFK
jgi:hypothetical protein